MGKTTNIDQAVKEILNNVSSDKIESRFKGLKELQTVVREDSRRPRKQQITDSGYHIVLENLFRGTKYEIIYYAKARKSAGVKAESRLAICASLVRSIVEVNQRKLGPETVKAILEHVCQSLPTADGNYCDPLVPDYVRALASILDYKPHLENLPQEELYLTIDFCVRAARDLNDTLDEDFHIDTNGRSPHDRHLAIQVSNPVRFGRSATPAAPSDVRGASNRDHSQRMLYPQLQSSAGGIVICIQHICSVPAIALLDKASEILDTLFALLTTYPSATTIQQPAFEAINFVVARVITTDVALTLRALKRYVVLVKSFWQTRASGLKEVILTTLIHGQVLFPLLIAGDDNDSVNCKADLCAVVEIMRQEYCERRIKDQLLFEDIDLSEYPFISRAQQSDKFRPARLRLCAVRAEEPCATLRVSASILAAIYDEDIGVHHSNHDDASKRHSKKQRLTTLIDEIADNIRGLKLDSRLYGLQVAAFLLAEQELDSKLLADYLEILLPSLSDEDAAVASWTMFAISSATSQAMAASPQLKLLWLSIWRLVLRQVTFSGTCKAACYLLTAQLDRGLVEYAEVADQIDSMTASADLNGPAECDGAATRFWQIILVLRRQENLSSANATSETILHWLWKRWCPASTNDRHSVVYKAHQICIASLVELICACLGLPLNVSEQLAFRRQGRLSHAYLEASQNREMTEYLAFEGAHLSNKKRDELSLKSRRVDTCASNSANHPLASSVLGFFTSQSLRMHRELFIESARSTLIINADVFRLIGAFLIAGYAMLSDKALAKHDHSEQLLKVMDVLVQDIIRLVLEHERQGDLLDGLIDAIGFLPCSVSQLVSSENILADGVIGVASRLHHIFRTDSGSAQNVTSTPRALKSMDSIDADEDFGLFSKTERQRQSNSDIVHSTVLAMISPARFKMSTIAKVCLMSMLPKPSKMAESTDNAISSAFVNYVTDLNRQNFLLCKDVTLELLKSDVPLTEDDADTLLQYLSQTYTTRYETQRAEFAVGVCLEIMAELVGMWTHDESDCAGAGAELYNWLMGDVLSGSHVSPYIHDCAAALFEKIIRARPDYAKDRSMASARTSLFGVLRSGSLAVKFKLAADLPSMFGLFVLKEHDHILEDVIGVLPNDPAYLEGIALRLYVLAKLACSWPTLLRRCIYAIFETPGSVRRSAGYAEYCMNIVSSSLGLAQGKDLFRLFVPQITFTWLEDQPLRLIPFSVFGYTTFKAMLLDVQDEVMGQIAMRGKGAEAEQVARDLDLSFEALLESSFAKAMAYSTARDIAIPPSKSSETLGAEARLRKTLGKERFATLIAKQFPDILALLFVTLNSAEETIEKAFQKHPTYATASAAYHEMIAVSCSAKNLPPNQQPCFKARFLLDEIEFLCRRTSYDPEIIWTPDLYVYVFRKLLDRIHPALGSLHTCSVLRKLRILIAISGITALEQYPLEMALHALRPFLTNTQCAEDTIGMFQYLIIHGSSYLAEVPSFLIGLATTSLLSMKAFFDSTQDSTTQESDFLATMTKAQTFHKWWSDWLSKYESTKWPSEEAAQSFRTIVAKATLSREPGNARMGTYESDLLFEVFEDERSERDLIDAPSRKAILHMLCHNFEPAPDFRDDIFGKEEDAARYASILWNSCKRGLKNHHYVLWCGRVLGRAYASKGYVDPSMMLEAPLDIGASSRAAPLQQASRIRIIQMLCVLLRSDNRSEAGVAEASLRRMLMAAHSGDILADHESCLPVSLISAMTWSNFRMPLGSAPQSDALEKLALKDCAAFPGSGSPTSWIQRLTIALCNTATGDPLLAGLIIPLDTVEGLAVEAFPLILHLVLVQEIEKPQLIRTIISQVYQQWFEIFSDTGEEIASLRILIKAILYLRTQALPHETIQAERDQWLEVDYRRGAVVALKCCMYKTALMFLEIYNSDYLRSQAITSRRDSRRRLKESEIEVSELLLDIYQHVDEQDAFYGVQQPSSLSSMMNQLEYEHAGYKSLSFRGAYYDGQIRQSSRASEVDPEGMVRALDCLDLNGLSQSLLGKITSTGAMPVDAALHTARKLEQWDISAPSNHCSPASATFRLFQRLNHATDELEIHTALNAGLSELTELLLAGKALKSSMHSVIAGLAVLAECDEICSCRGSDQVEEIMTKMDARTDWMRAESFERVSSIISCRETLFGFLCKKANIQGILKVPVQKARSLEARALLTSSQISRSHGALQNALATSTYLNQLCRPCYNSGIDISKAVRFESAHVLWSQGETTASIRMLQDLCNLSDPKTEGFEVGRAELLAKLGHQISEARLEKPDEIIKTYLTPAIQALNNSTEGDEASEVFHEFAFFCDQQLQNADGLEDFERIRKLRERKVVEVQDLDNMIKKAPSQGRDRENLRNHRNKARLWLELDDREYQRLRDGRQMFLRQSLENYLLCLKASDSFDNDALRFSALWLENFESDIANIAVAKHLGQVGSRKFAPLMNQWSSRLLNNDTPFQTLLFNLVLRICMEHPYHGMYQIFASSKSKGGKDEAAMARYAAANGIVEKLRSCKNKRVSETWVNVHNTNLNFVRFAHDKIEDASVKQGSKVLLKKLATGQRIEQEVQKHSVPPPTITLPLRADCDYKSVPLVRRFLPEFTLAGGISAPKIVTAIGTDGQRYKQLFKGGNDDLRQDAIMEQVFAAVSSLLATQQSTRERALKIRTYKVLPLTATAGIIEFVPNTIPLHDYLLPAHMRHYPRDLKPNICRKHISEVQTSSVDNRIKTFRKVEQQFHPVLRYFFFERFQSPDTWFDNRLAYIRSTAAISILGHVLGLGDRHGHNILLDETTGEVVHIDLGIAFEQGRVLPVPEVVPFRLTRDLVDGMGITGTEGVFRRCCEFTLDALRNESYSIMTILDVLRYDPLYSWSLSPLRVKKMQEQGDEGGGGMGDDEVGRLRGDEEPGEADRALTVVKKKLSRSLSVQATVNELITAATDERNLAVLFCGWAAYA